MDEETKKTELLRLYEQYRQGLIGMPTIEAKFKGMASYEKYEDVLSQYNLEECYNSDHCCYQCCDCEWDDEGNPLTEDQ